MENKFRKLAPDLMVLDVSKAVRYYTDTLGFKLDMVVPEDSRVIEKALSETKRYSYAMVSRDEVFVMFMRSDVYGDDVPALKDKPIGASASFYCEVDDVMDLYNLYKKRDVNIVKDIETTWYGMKEFYIKDCNGYILAFAQRM